MQSAEMWTKVPIWVTYMFMKSGVRGPRSLQRGTKRDFSRFFKGITNRREGMSESFVHACVEQLADAQVT